MSKKARPTFCDELRRSLSFSDCDDIQEEDFVGLDLENSVSDFVQSTPKSRLESLKYRRMNTINRILSEHNSLSPSSDERSLNSSSDCDMSSVKKKLGWLPVENITVEAATPYRKVRALKLFPSPRSPQSLLQRAELNNSDVCMRTQPESPPLLPPLPLFHLTPISKPYDKNHNIIRGRPLSTSCRTRYSSPNFNPFSNSHLSPPISHGKRRRNGTINRTPFSDIWERCENEGGDHSIKPKILNDKTTSRFKEDFTNLTQIGSGEYGVVYRCVNRCDGSEYAVKKLRRPRQGTSSEARALKEVTAHAQLGHHKHVVRYYSAWHEEEDIFIQNEYCSSGSLAEMIDKRRNENSSFSEPEVKLVLHHVALGLQSMHSSNLAHMDIKPGNIFIVKNQRFPGSPGSVENGFEDCECVENEFIYKIGDFGHVTNLSDTPEEEGDCRYMPYEMLDEKVPHLPKVDIFSLGMTIYEMCTRIELPKNGDEWHFLRQGQTPDIHGYSKELNDLIREMLNKNPDLRPSSTALVNNQTLVPYVCKTKEQLNNELNAALQRSKLLQKELLNLSSNTSMSRLIGGKTNRSQSVSNF